MKAIILAAGKGERLRPLTDTLPKVMIKIGNKPCIQHNIELLKKHGIRDIAINTHYLPEKIKEYLGSGEKFGVKIKYSFEPEILGTAGALNNFRDFFDETFVVIYGDVIHQTNLSEMLKFHKEKEGFATLALDDRSQVGRGVIILDEKDEIIQFVEKPKEKIPGGLINSGIYIVEPEIMNHIPKGFSDFGNDILPRLLTEGKKLFGFRTGKVIDIGSLEDLEEARKLFERD